MSASDPERLVGSDELNDIARAEQELDDEVRRRELVENEIELYENACEQLVEAIDTASSSALGAALTKVRGLLAGRGEFWAHVRGESEREMGGEG